MKKTNQIDLITNHLFRNPKITLAARGTFITIAALPECTFPPTFELICKILPDPQPAIKKALDELCCHQYLIHKNENNDAYIINENKINEILTEV